MDDDTTLADLLALNLHNYEEQVQEIVDKATKEMGMEKVQEIIILHHVCWCSVD